MILLGIIIIFYSSYFLIQKIRIKLRLRFLEKNLDEDQNRETFIMSRDLFLAFFPLIRSFINPRLSVDNTGFVVVEWHDPFNHSTLIIAFTEKHRFLTNFFNEKN